MPGRCRSSEWRKEYVEVVAVGEGELDHAGVLLDLVEDPQRGGDERGGVVEVAEVRRTERHELVEFVLVQLQVLQTRPPDDAAQRMAHKTYLKVLQLQRIYVVLDLDGQAMRGFLNLLLSLALINRRE